MPGTSIRQNKAYEAKPIEKMISQAIIQGEKLDDGIKQIYPVDPNRIESRFDIRADKFEIAQASLDAVQKAKTARGDGKIGGEKEVPGPGPEDKGKEV